MNGFTNNATRLAIPESVRKTIKAAALPMMAALVVLLTAASSYADCGPMAGMKFPIVKLPLVATANLAAVGGMPNSESRDSIVGLWHTMYTAGDSPFAETFKQWHSDGTDSKTSITILQLDPSVWEYGSRWVRGWFTCATWVSSSMQMAPLPELSLWKRQIHWQRTARPMLEHSYSRLMT